MKGYSKLIKLLLEGLALVLGGVFKIIIIDRFLCIMTAIFGALIFVIGLSQYVGRIPSFE